jgi:ATP-dependent DNA helicase RecG
MIDLSLAQSADRITALLAAAESRTLEFKRISGKQSRMYEAVCAFANTDGGLLVIGIGDAKAMKPGDKPPSRLFGIEENPEGFDNFRTELLTRFTPAITRLHWIRVACTLHNGQPGHVVLLRVEKSDQVHSVVGNGTWTRLDASNRELNAVEIADLAYQRGVKSAETEPVAVALELLDTPVWRNFVVSRGLRAGTQTEQLLRIGLAERVTPSGGGSEEVLPRRAAVLLFAEEPGSLLAAFGGRADLRLMVYAGKEMGAEALPNLRKPPKTIRGPLIEQIDLAVKAVLDELALGLTLASSGFKTRHKYPDRVVKEAIVNAVIHRDYRLNRDIVVRVFDDRIVVESPGALPGSITPGNIQFSRSKARNPLIAMNLREFAVPPNIDDGEGVRMMFGEMAAAQLYPPQYRQSTETAVQTLSLTLFNEARPAVWAEVNDWVERNGPIANADVCRIASVDTLKASKMLRAWVDRGLLEPLPGRVRSNAAYRKPTQADEQLGLLQEVGESGDSGLSLG